MAGSGRRGIALVSTTELNTLVGCVREAEAGIHLEKVNPPAGLWEEFLESQISISESSSARQ